MSLPLLHVIHCSCSITRNTQQEIRYYIPHSFWIWWSLFKTLLSIFILFFKKETKLIVNNYFFFNKAFIPLFLKLLNTLFSNLRLNHSWIYTYFSLVSVLSFISSILFCVKQNGQEESVDINVQRWCFPGSVAESGSSVFIQIYKIFQMISIHGICLVSCQTCITNTRSEINNLSVI